MRSTQQGRHDRRRRDPRVGHGAFQAHRLDGDGKISPSEWEIAGKTQASPSLRRRTATTTKRRHGDNQAARPRRPLDRSSHAASAAAIARLQPGVR